MWVKLHRPLYMHYTRTRVGDTLQWILIYNSKRIKIYLQMKSVKLLSTSSIYQENKQKGNLYKKKTHCTLTSMYFALKIDDFESRYLKNKLGTVSNSFRFRM